jgi:hypothetical protein
VRKWKAYHLDDSFASAIFTVFFIPETKGKTLEDSKFNTVVLSKASVQSNNVQIVKSVDSLFGILTPDIAEKQPKGEAVMVEDSAETAAKKKVEVV